MHLHQKLGLFGLASYIPASLGYPSSVGLTSRADKFVWGAIGDSWASGVTYGIAGSTDYDGNKDECLRINHAYSVQVSDKAADWIPDGQEQEFHFAACSGSRLVNMIREPINGHKQMDEVGDKPRVVLMQAGGNNANFYDVASNCLFHDQEKDYGPAFPEQGECTAAIGRAGGYIRDKNQLHHLEFDLSETIKEILDQQRDNQDFRLYVIGYAHFFDVRDEATWCDDFTFTLPWKLQTRQNLVLGLRKEINGLVEDLNQGLRRVAEGFNSPKVGYIDVSKGFDGHRFCEVGQNGWDQFFGSKVWLWNYVGEIFTLQGNEYSSREPTEEEFDKWLQTGKFTDDPAEVVTWEGEEVINSPHQGASPGSQLRPFHPKKDGHRVMSEAIVERLKADLAAASPIDNPPPPPPPPSPTKALQVVLNNYIDEITNANYWSFFQLKPGEKLSFCNTRDVLFDNDGKHDAGGDIDNPPWPRKDEWTLELHGEKDCKYYGTGDGPGTLRCPSMTEDVHCEEDSGKGGGEGATEKCEAISWGENYHPVVYCKW